MLVRLLKHLKVVVTLNACVRVTVAVLCVCLSVTTQAAT